MASRKIGAATIANQRARFIAWSKLPKYDGIMISNGMKAKCVRKPTI